MIKKLFVLLLTLLLFSCCSFVFGAPPVLFFSDLTDGPTSGWEGSSTKGAAVTVWGLNFGTSRGTNYITCGGVDLMNDSDYAEWGVINKPKLGEDPNDVYSSARSLQRITFWLKSSMTIGVVKITVTTLEGTSNDDLFFYCRNLSSNHIYFISRSGNDSNNGVYASQGMGNNGPWFSANKVRILEAGDVAYFREGIWNEDDGYDCVIRFYDNHGNGQENNSITITSYPGEIAQLGDNSIKYVMRHHGWSTIDVLRYWTFSKFLMRGTGGVTYWGVDGSGSDDHIRFIGNDGSTYSTGAVAFSFDGQDGGQTYLYFYGNHVHDTGVNNRGDVVTLATRAYPLYFEGYGTHNYIYIGWNEFSYNEKGRGMQFYGHTNTDWIDNLYVHDNYVHHNGMHGAILGGGDGALVPYEFMKNCFFYNNVVAFNGQRGTATGILVGGEASGGKLGGNWYIYNNTFYKNLGGEITTSWTSKPTNITFKNNIIVACSEKDYYVAQDIGTFFNGSNNCYYGGGDGPSWDSNRLDNTNPEFIVNNPSTNLDFRIKETSPCRNIGTLDVGAIVKKDYLGVLRVQGGKFDIGAYEWAEEYFFLASSSLSNVKVAPNPFKPGRGDSIIRFTNLTGNSEIKIYTVSGELVKKISKEEIQNNLTVEWDVRNAQGEDVVSGVYVYCVINEQGNKKYGNFSIIK